MSLLQSIYNNANYCYERTHAHLDNKQDPNLYKNAQYFTVKACTRHKINPGSQLCAACSSNEDLLLPNRRTWVQLL